MLADNDWLSVDGWPAAATLLLLLLPVFELEAELVLELAVAELKIELVVVEPEVDTSVKLVLYTDALIVLKL